MDVKIIKRIGILIWLISVCVLGGHLALASDIMSAPVDSPILAVKPVTVEFFNEPGCEECAMVNDQILPELEQRYSGYYVLTRLDLGVMTNYLRLVSYQKQLGEVNAPVYMVLDGRKIFSGFKDIKANLFAAMDQMVVGQMESPPATLSAPAISPNMPCAVESLLLARYQMYGAVYWHHSFRCLLSMFTFAASSAFEPFKSGQGRIRNKKIDVKTVRELLYHRVVCGKTWIECVSEVAKSSPQIGIETFQDTPAKVATEPIFDFIWQFADEASRELIRRLADRALFKRVFEIRVGELGGHTNYSAIKALLSPSDRVAKARLLRKRLLDAVGTAMRVKGTAVTVSEDAARLRLQELEKSTLPLVLIDFPTRGMPSERNYPRQLGDPERKYFTVPKQQEVTGDNVFHVVRCLQENAATIRVFAAPEFHELIVRYLPPLSVRQCVSSVIPEIPAE